MTLISVRNCGAMPSGGGIMRQYSFVAPDRLKCGRKDLRAGRHGGFDTDTFALGVLHGDICALPGYWDNLSFQTWRERLDVVDQNGKAHKHSCGPLFLRRITLVQAPFYTPGYPSAFMFDASLRRCVARWAGIKTARLQMNAPEYGEM